MQSEAKTNNQTKPLSKQLIEQINTAVPLEGKGTQLLLKTKEIASATQIEILREKEEHKVRDSEEQKILKNYEEIQLDITNAEKQSNEIVSKHTTLQKQELELKNEVSQSEQNLKALKTTIDSKQATVDTQKKHQEKMKELQQQVEVCSKELREANIERTNADKATMELNRTKDLKKDIALLRNSFDQKKKERETVERQITGLFESLAKAQEEHKKEKEDTEIKLKIKRNRLTELEMMEKSLITKESEIQQRTIIAQQDEEILF
ncbi:hypothetical protein EIN_152790 [Entamoeba invadens IP1]|uniref:Uncharacterized protein n=1 Tax=Entamoeba invadens IP1 TaxID=370355 RepID=A0A0A1U8V9_ENTIV|nr:hypothetical protein EIN_152790 [Entamoeba invadens IP1]ELP91282.1 hypothetical protein EIN_152790 [Entamoeba invadens IP1]|eukprot:XP_004258053.1 hypothetical protein EIN_152790 [Entamoeba invadens IP1]